MVQNLTPMVGFSLTQNFTPHQLVSGKLTLCPVVKHDVRPTNGGAEDLHQQLVRSRTRDRQASELVWFTGRALQQASHCFRNFRHDAKKNITSHCYLSLRRNAQKCEEEKWQLLKFREAKVSKSKSWSTIFETGQVRCNLDKPFVWRSRDTIHFISHTNRWTNSWERQKQACGCRACVYVWRCCLFFVCLAWMSPKTQNSSGFPGWFVDLQKHDSLHCLRTRRVYTAECCFVASMFISIGSSLLIFFAVCQANFAWVVFKEFAEITLLFMVCWDVGCLAAVLVDNLDCARVERSLFLNVWSCVEELVHVCDVWPWLE